MAAEAMDIAWKYNQELVQVMREHRLIQPEEEEQMLSYLVMV